jgi:23S rRNA (guanine2069-N7)-methyltransferase / 23S rRNA (guanine2445-N2)-methyltransferase
LARELVALGAADARERSTGVTFSGSLEVAYRACLWSRVANRVFLELARFDAADADGFYRAVREIDWTDHLGPEATLACDFSGHHPAITHTHFGALKLKDAIVDSVREERAWRPSVELERPSVRVHAHANGTQITLSLDLSGESLHRRGYRGAAGEAPLKENVAAGVLMRSGWPEMAAQGAAFLDPMCGSGTFVIEAALIATDRAPGLERDYFGFLGWAGHDAEVWRQVLEEAQGRARSGLEGALGRGLAGALRGQDRDPGAIRNARANADRASVRELVQFDVSALDAVPAGRIGSHAGSGRAGLIKASAQGDADAPVDAATRAGVGGPAGGALGDKADVSEGGALGTEADVPAGAALRTEADVAAIAAEGIDAVEPAVAGAAAGLVCTNPPYGVRLEDRETARAVHRELGAVLREHFQGWSAAVLTGSPEFGLELGIRAHRTHTVWNGAIECRLLRMKIDTGSVREPGRLGKGETHLRDTPGAQMFANRLAKNLKKQQAWADRSGISCYRLYDADMPEYAFAIDVYRTFDEPPGRSAATPPRPSPLSGTPAPSSNPAPSTLNGRQPPVAASGQTWLYVQEYAAPSEIELDAVRRRRGEALSTLSDVTGVDPDHIRIRTRRKTKRGEQYAKVQDRSDYHVVVEDGLKFLVNFDDYLDTGLFLDHRMTRARLRVAAAGKRFLNLFAYTCTATVYAAAGGAASTTSVDMSNTYLNWAQRNFELNDLSPERNGLVQADCRMWLEGDARNRERYDLIFIDPPTFSNSKRMEGVLDVDRDHPALIDGCMRLLAPGGLVVFSTNSQRFRLDESLTRRYDVVDISTKTLPKDFERNPRIHRCFEVRGKT